MGDQDFDPSCISDPMERSIAIALSLAGFHYLHETEGDTDGLDFVLMDGNVAIEVKQMHSPRIAAQMARRSDVIAIQGARAVKLFNDLLYDLASMKRELRLTTDALAAASMKGFERGE